MRTSELKELFRTIVKEYFNGATVVYAKESRIAKPNLPLVTLTIGDATRDTHSADETAKEYKVSNYQSKVPVTIDLFTKGDPVMDDDGMIVAYSDSSLDDMLAFADYLDSEYVTDYTNKYNFTILIDQGVQSLTGVVNDNNYEYRARMSVMLYYVHQAVGRANVLLEKSIVYAGNDEATIEPKFEQTSSGGGTQKLAELETGYFGTISITESKENKSNG